MTKHPAVAEILSVQTIADIKRLGGKKVKPPVEKDAKVQLASPHIARHQKQEAARRKKRFVEVCAKLRAKHGIALSAVSLAGDFRNYLNDEKLPEDAKTLVACAMSYSPRNISLSNSDCKEIKFRQGKAYIRLEGDSDWFMVAAK